MLLRRLLVLMGFLTLVAGVIQVFRPRAFWQFWEAQLIWGPFERVPATVYFIGAISILIGLLFLYIALRRLALFVPLMWVVGALALVYGILMVLSPTFFRDLMNTIFYGRADATKLGLSYLGGIIRFFVGVLLIIAGLSRPPVRQAPEAAEVEASSEGSQA